ncbi:MAM and LDL-receptor class A domain-containing protein 1-like [Diadema antillarum]|uniref:MAM and LDL-receptor class A domain-containing protein 1-like n=1 Tax=Diadema antillarum TaxID=105358 RepID=UPI003A883202
MNGDIYDIPPEMSASQIISGILCPQTASGIGSCMLFNNSSSISTAVGIICCDRDNCTNPGRELGLEDGRVADSQLTASGRSGYATAGRYGGLHDGWYPESHDLYQWFQVDFLCPHLITGVKLQRGRVLGNNSVTSFTLTYTLSGSVWTPYKDEFGNVKYFPGVPSQDMIDIYHALNPSPVARYVRLNPKTWSDEITLRMELLGLGPLEFWDALAEINCTFDEGFCGWSQSDEDDFDWSIQGSGYFIPSSVCPHHDRTSGYGGYVSLDTEGKSKQVAELNSPSYLMPENDNVACLRFWFYMTGSNIGNLRALVIREEDWANETVFEITGNQGNIWLEATADVNVLRGTFLHLTLEVEVDSGESGCIAVDDVELIPGACPPIKGRTNCDFDLNLCGWRQDVEDDFDWAPISKFLLSSGKGPPRDRSMTGYGRYLQVELNKHPSNHVARLVSPDNHVTATGYTALCFSFAYYAPTGGNSLLRVYVAESGNNKIFGSDHGTTLDCSFDVDLCNWVQHQHDDQDWIRGQDELGTSDTGPTSDHTRGGHYLYASPQGQQNSRLDTRPISMPLDPNGWCFKFWYFLHGPHIGELVVKLNYYHGGVYVGTRVVLSASGDLGNQWILQQVIVTGIDSWFEVIIEANSKDGQSGEFAIDDTYLAPGPCQTGDPTRCGFETIGICDFIVENSGVRWERTTGINEFSIQGPLYDHTFGDERGFYMFVNSSAGTTGKTATMTSPKFTSRGRYCVRFWYHMLGRGIGNLTMGIKYIGAEPHKPILSWTKNGQQGADWKHASVSVSADTQFTVVFEAIVGPQVDHRIALDDVTISRGHCSGIAPQLEDTGQIGCQKNGGLPLGVENGQIGDQALSASSFKLDDHDRFTPQRGRLNEAETSSGWLGNYGVFDWYKVDIGIQRWVTGVQTQGGYGTTDGARVVTVSLSNDDSVWDEMPGPHCDLPRRRLNGNADFNLPWDDYAHGFGDLGENHWLGLEQVRRIFHNRTLQLRIDMEDDSGTITYAKYSSFAIDSAENVYRLTISGYNGDAGDGLSHSDGSAFSTAERINDPNMDIPCDSCCPSGGWWYNGCGQSNLNGVYPGDKQGGHALLWNNRILTFVEMKEVEDDFDWAPISKFLVLSGKGPPKDCSMTGAGRYLQVELNKHPANHVARLVSPENHVTGDGYTALCFSFAYHTSPGGRNLLQVYVAESGDDEFIGSGNFTDLDEGVIRHGWREGKVDFQLLGQKSYVVIISVTGGGNLHDDVIAVDNTRLTIGQCPTAGIGAGCSFDFDFCNWNPSDGWLRRSDDLGTSDTRPGPLHSPAIG